MIWFCCIPRCPTSRLQRSDFSRCLAKQLPLWISLFRHLVSQFYIGRYCRIEWAEGRHSLPSDIYSDTAGEQRRSAT